MTLFILRGVLRVDVERPILPEITGFAVVVFVLSHQTLKVRGVFTVDRKRAVLLKIVT